VLRARIPPTFITFNSLCYLYLAVCRQRELSAGCPLAGRIVAKSDSYLRFDSEFQATVMACRPRFFLRRSAHGEAASRNHHHLGAFVVIAKDLAGRSTASFRLRRSVHASTEATGERHDDAQFCHFSAKRNHF
jgi:hypothetical protein